MDPQLTRDRLRAADKLLQGETTTLEQVESIKKLLRGLNPKVDTLLTSCTKALKHLEKFEKLQRGDVIELSAQVLPETTEKEKRRKKALLLFLTQWRQLKNEVVRIEKEFAPSGQPKTAVGKTMSIGRILGLAKGPLGLVTLVAAGIVFLRASATTIHMTNEGCGPITPVTSISVHIPGLSLLDQPIVNGQTATAVIPPLTVTVDGTDQSIIRLFGYGLNFQFQLKGSGIDLLFNGTSLLGRRTTIRLADQPNHTLLIRCR